MTEPVEETDPAEGEPAEDRTDWKAAARKWEARAKENADAAKRLTALEEANKSAEQKAAEARVSAEKQRDEAVLALLKRDVAEEAGLPKAWASRLQGSTQAELEADAKSLAKDLPKPNTSTGGRPVPDLRSAALPAGDTTRPPSTSAEIDAHIRRSLRRN